MLLWGRASNGRREQEPRGLADRLQASMQEVQQAMDIQRRNLPRRPSPGLRKRNVYPSNGRGNLEPSTGPSKVLFSTSTKTTSNPQTLLARICRVRRLVCGGCLRARALDWGSCGFGSLRAPDEH